MGLFGSNSPFDADVEKVTDEKNTQENWAAIMDICDRVTASSSGPKEVLRSISKRLNSPVPNVAMQALVLLDACVKNCKKNFHLEVASRDMEQEIKRIILKGHPKVSEKLKVLLKKWAEGEFKDDPQLSLIPSLYSKLKHEGASFSSIDAPTTEKKVSFQSDAASRQEEDDIAKAIELSLKEAGSGGSSGSPKQQQPTSSSSSLYPTSFETSGYATASPAIRKVRALYDFEAAEDNELTFYAGELVSVIDDSDNNWWKGSNQRGEGLFPANFVTADLSAEPDQFKMENKKTVQFSESVEVKTLEREPEVVEIDEDKILQALNLLHQADPTGEREDVPEMLHLEEQVSLMSPLIEAEIDRIDRRHAQLTSVNSELADSLNLYHNLMRESSKIPFNPYPMQAPPGAAMPPAAPGYGPPPTGPPQGYPGAMPPPMHAFIPPNPAAPPGGYVPAMAVGDGPSQGLGAAPPPPSAGPLPPSQVPQLPPPQMMYSGGDMGMPPSYGHIPQGNFPQSPPQTQPLL